MAKKCQCPTCGEWFVSVNYFDKHRTGPMTARRCLDAEEMTRSKMHRKVSGVWGGPPMTPEQAQKLKGRG